MKKHLLMVLFVAVFGGVGAYLLLASHAYVTSYANVSVQVNFVNASGQVIGSGYGVTVNTVPAGPYTSSDYSCLDQTTRTSGSTTVNGNTTFRCGVPDAYSTTPQPYYYETYNFTGSKSGYKSASVTSPRLTSNSYTSLTLNLQLIDADGDNIGDSNDLCPTVAGTPSYKGCPGSQVSGWSANPNTVTSGSTSNIAWSVWYTPYCSLSGPGGSSIRKRVFVGPGYGQL